MASSPLTVYVGEALAAYGFGEEHPFGPDRMYAFWARMQDLGLDSRVDVREPVQATETQILRFQEKSYVEQVKKQSLSGFGYLDACDTPAFRGIFEAASTVVGTVLAALDDIVSARCRQAFVPIAGLHHARRDAAAGFCVFNDCGIAIETLRRQYGIQRVAYRHRCASRRWRVLRLRGRRGSCVCGLPRRWPLPLSRDRCCGRNR